MKHAHQIPVSEHFRVLFEVGSVAGVPDAELLARFVNRDGDSAELAFSALVERHAGIVMRICRAIVRNEQDAEDAFQATFLNLALKAGRLRVGESLGPWLSSVAQRVSRGARAVAIARAAREVRAAELATVRESISDSGSDISLIVQEELERLPERYRLPLLLCDIERCTQHEAARRLGWPLGTVKSRQARGRARLRAGLMRRGLSGTSPVAGLIRFTHFSISLNLIRSTARAAVRLLSRGTSGRGMPASVATLTTNCLRATIVTRLLGLVGVVLLITAGVAASVLAQGHSERKKTGTERDVAAAAPAPVFEYEIRIWKDGAPVTPTMKLRAHPGDVSEVKIPEGTFEVRFRAKGDAGKAIGPNGDNDTGGVRRLGLADVAGEARQELAQAILDNKLDIIEVEADIATLKDARPMGDEVEEKLENQIKDDFQKEPDVIALCEDVALADDVRAQARARYRQGDHLVRQIAEVECKKLRLQYDQLWKVKYGEIRERLKNAARRPEQSESNDYLKKKLASLKSREAQLNRLKLDLERMSGRPIRVDSSKSFRSPD